MEVESGGVNDKNEGGERRWKREKPSMISRL